MIKVDVDDFSRTASWKFVNEVEIEASPEKVWAAVTEDAGWAVWHPEVSDITWLTPTPHGVGSRRTVKFNQSMLIQEYFTVWKENERFSFYFEKTNMRPCVSFVAAAEDFEFERLPNGNTMFRRSVYMEPSVVIKTIGCSVKANLAKTFKACIENLAKALKDNKLPLLQTDVITAQQATGISTLPHSDLQS